MKMRKNPKYDKVPILILTGVAEKEVIIEIKDNGGGLTKSQSQGIFEKFYRVPKGNTHDVKGFGIGLYYTNTIIEKHQGTIKVDALSNLTKFIISLPL